MYTCNHRLSPWPSNLSFLAAARMRRPGRLENQGLGRGTTFLSSHLTEEQSDSIDTKPAYSSTQLKPWKLSYYYYRYYYYLLNNSARPFAQHEHSRFLTTTLYLLLTAGWRSWIFCAVACPGSQAREWLSQDSKSAVVGLVYSSPCMGLRWITW